MDDQFRLEFRNLDACTMARLKGDLTKSAEESVLQARAWEEGLDGGRKYLVLDFTEVPYINSAGIAILIRLTRTGIKADYASFAFGLSAHYQKLFRMVGLTEQLMIYPDEYSVMRRIEELRKET